MFHVLTHAFFKACLFLGSGSVIHALGGEQDLRRMGGLSRRIPVTYATFLVATLAIAGVPLLTGFFSKDAILAAVFEARFTQAPWLPRVLWSAALFTAGLTAFYMFRLVSLAFLGRFRGTPEQEARIHESGKSMTVPLGILAFLSIVGGWIGIPIVRGGNRIGDFLAPVIPALAGAHPAEHHAAVSLEVALMAASVGAAMVGLLLAWLWYAKGEGRVPAMIAARFPRLYRTVANKYFVDEFYEAVFVEGLAKGGGRFLWEVDATVVDLIPNGTAAATRGASLLSDVFDQNVVDGAVNGVADGFEKGWRLVRRAQTGAVQNYALVMGAGLFGLVAVYLIFR
jgi:NADH-quinone oxidoreductase subunit L